MKPRVVVVSHACVLAANQSVYAALERDFDVTLVVPESWRDELRARPYRAQRLDRFFGGFVTARTLGRGRPQRHVSVLRAGALLRQRRADLLIIEEEPFSLAAIRWSLAARRLQVPYVVQAAENLDKVLPGPLRRACERTASGASFVLARSPAALEQIRTWGYEGPPTVIPHGVDDVVAEVAERPVGVVGFVGRLVEAKGVDDLLDVLRARPALRLRVAGDGPLRSRVAALGERASLLGALEPGQMSSFYDSIAVLAVPSRSTATWSEQFGRVLVEAQARGVPVVAYDSGEIPWVAANTAVVTVVEGDVEALGDELERLANDPVAARELGESGRRGVVEHFTTTSVAEVLTAAINEALARPR